MRIIFRLQQNAITKDHESRFVVQMPFKEEEFKLGLSKNLALRRFLNLERKLISDTELHERYSHFIKEYIDLGHMNKNQTAN